MIVIPIRLVACNIYDADDHWIALLRGEREEYRAHGAEIIAAVNSHADLLDAAKELLLALEQTMHARKIGLAGDWKTIEEAETRMQMKAQAAIAHAEQCQ